jgi:anti-anti-sigma factor
MEIQKERVGDVAVVSVNGRLDGIYSSAFANQIGKLITGENPKILIDFTDIDFVTSAGLRALLVLIKKAKATGACSRCAASMSRCARFSTSAASRRCSASIPVVPRALRP